jgi:hypothetical protein
MLFGQTLRHPILLQCVVHPLRVSYPDLCIQRPPLPPEVMGEIARAAWVDVTLWDHAALYVALVSIHPYLREIMPRLAWTYVFCRSRRDFALYLHLRFGDVLSDQKVYERHAELHISSNFRREIEELVHQRPFHPRLSISIITAIRSVPHRKLFSAAPMTAMYSAFSDVPHPMDPHVGLDLSLAYADTITDLRVVNTYFHWGMHEHYHVYSSVTRLVIVYAKDHSSNWAKAPRFRQMFPALRALTLRGGSTGVQSILPLLPEDLDELVLDAQLYPTVGASSVHLWDLLPALKAGFRVGGGEHAPRVVLLTGANEPLGWQEAVSVADEKGVHLERRIEYRPPCTTSATLRPVPYDLNVVFCDL